MTGAIKQDSSKERLIKTLHIDTSLQIERCKIPAISDIVEKTIEAFDFSSTSTFAKFEFLRAWIRDLLYLYDNSLDIKRPEDLTGLVNHRLNKCPYNKRRVSRCLDGIQKYLSLTPGNIPYDAAVVRFRAHLRNGILGSNTWWERSIHYEFDGTGCMCAKEKPVQRVGGRIEMIIKKCKPERIECQIKSFFEKNKHLFIKIKEAIESLDSGASKELLNAKDTIETVLKKPYKLCDDSVCSKLGDIIIAIDGIEMDTFAANNDKEWVLIAQTLDKQLLNPLKKD